ncbi:uncharacterized protein LOC127869724 [Dreissena polymorpha]|uniref:uncharacterized protein LOC127869724 n=1 Tax=Dreissena polymorpha TaxID=45954 RepID=UPI0022654745|nr:uncharacterized protein LOC127869724 [Dreissena polymorpha]
MKELVGETKTCKRAVYVDKKEQSDPSEMKDLLKPLIQRIQQLEKKQEAHMYIGRNYYRGQGRGAYATSNKRGGRGTSYDRGSGSEIIRSKNQANVAYTLYISGAATTVVGADQYFTGSSLTDRIFGINVEQTAPNMPVFGTTTYTSGSSTILDNTAGGVSIGTVTFTDADGANTISITMAPNSYFTFVDKGDGTGSVTTTADTINFPISDQSGTTVTLTFTATDTCGGTAQGTMPIIVQNIKPTLTGLTPGVTTSEIVDAERRIANYTCSDPSDNVTPTITVSPSNSPEYFVTRFFSGTSKTGVYEIVLPTQSTSWQFNYDTVNSYTIVVQCSDGKPSGTASATLVVSLTPNQPPEITNLPRKNAYNDRLE